MIAEDQSEAIAFLSRPESHGPGVSAVERIDTHAAIVFLAGGRAYKLKRAVRYSYLDYSTVALRRRHCESELALNRRTAPTLYLAVRALTRRAEGGLAFDGDGPAVDYVVAMRRFDQAALFDRLAAKGALGRPLMCDLAERIAEFHAEAAPIQDMGGRAGLAEVIAGNSRDLAQARPGLFDPAAVAAIGDAARAALRRQAPLLEDRRLGGRVRHCHGDLHLRNICLVDGRPTLFDCVEFSRSLACIDLLYDLAFLLMDLCHRGLDPLANAVLNRYLDHGDEEPAGLAALPLFLSARAAIRAHVDALAAGRQDEAAAAERLVEAARGYLAVAGALLRPAPAVLVAIGGPSGAGKSTLAYGLAPSLGMRPGARVLRSDVLRKKLMKVPAMHRLPEAAYAPEVSERVYGALCREALAVLATGHSVVVDAVFARQSERDAIAAVAGAAHRPFHGFWLEAPAELLAARILGRRGDASDATPAVLRRQLARDFGRIDWVRLDAAADAERCLETARRRLAGGGAAGDLEPATPTR